MQTHVLRSPGTRTKGHAPGRSAPIIYSRRDVSICVCDCYAKRAPGGAKGQRQPSEVVVQPGHEPGRASSGDRVVEPILSTDRSSDPDFNKTPLLSSSKPEDNESSCR